MLTTALIAVLIVAAIGLIAMVVTKRFCNSEDSVAIYGSLQITWIEYVLATLAVTIVVIPSVLLIGKNIAVNEKLTFQEFRNGFEQTAPQHVKKCHAGHSSSSSASSGESNCKYTYVSGHYRYGVPYTTESCYKDSDGNRHCTTTTHCCHYYQANIESPYATEENTYSVTNSFGSYDYPGIYLDATPTAFAGRSIPTDIPHGAPADWIDAKTHIDAQNPRGVTKLFDYVNYVLGSTEESVKAYSSNIDQYLKAGLLPDHTANILKDPIYGDSRPQAKKVSFVGVNVNNQDVWQNALMQYNAALGSKLQGDMHVVVIDSQKVSDSDSQKYLNALKAYWQGSHFGKRAIAKNAIILAIGVSNNTTITWAKASTGMPGGNNVMLRTMESSLLNQPLDSNLIFGSPKTVLVPATTKGAKDAVKVTLSAPAGILENIVFSETPFLRACMKCAKGEGVGYSSLITQIQPSQTAKNWMIVIVCFISLFFWFGVAATNQLELGRFFTKSTQESGKHIRLDKE